MKLKEETRSWGGKYRNGGGNCSEEPNIEKHGQKKASKIGPGKAGELHRPGGNVAKGPGEKHGGGDAKGSGKAISKSVTVAERGEGGNCSSGAHEKQSKGSKRDK